MPDYDFGSLASPAKTPPKEAPKQSYDFGNLATSAPSAPAVSQKPPEKKMDWKDAALGTVFGPSEALLNMGTGLIAKPISDVAGMAATAKEMISPNQEPDAVGFKKYVQEGLTYQPRTTVGKVASGYNPLALVGKGIYKVADKAGNVVAGDESNSWRSAAGNLTREGIQQAVGFAVPALRGKIAARLGVREAELAAEKQANAQRDANLTSMREKGYVLPPSVAGVKGPLSDFFSAEAGGSKLDSGASIKNQRVTNGQVKKELGHAPDEQISVKSLDEIREKYGKPYEDVKKTVPTLKTTPQFTDALKNPNSSFAKARADFPEYFKDAEIQKLIKDLSKPEFSSEGAIEMQKVLRRDGYANLKAFDKPKQQALGEAQLNAASAIDNLIDQNLSMKAPPGVKNFQSKLSANLAEARKKIAQTYAVQGALNDATGNVSAKSLGKLWEKNRTLTGGLKDVAESHNAFPKQMRDVDSMPGTAHENISNMDVAKGAMLAGMGHGALGVASTLGRAAVKPMLLSDWYQAANIKPPTYKPGPAYTLPMYMGNYPAPMFGIPRPPQEQKE